MENKIACVDVVMEKKRKLAIYSALLATNGVIESFCFSNC